MRGALGHVHGSSASVGEPVGEPEAREALSLDD
jgi:hypothetical protein